VFNRLHLNGDKVKRRVSICQDGKKARMSKFYYEEDHFVLSGQKAVQLKLHSHTGLNMDGPTLD